MIQDGAFRTEPWRIREEKLDLDLLAQSESVLALANGHLGLRGNLDEGEPYGLPGTYLNGLHELRPLPYAEAGFGYPESGQMLINITNGKVIRLLVDDEPFDVRYGTLRHHERVLDFRAGTLRRTAEWVSPAGQPMRVTSLRLVSFMQRAVAAIEYVVEALDDRARIVVQSELVANEPMPSPDNDPRVAAALEAPLVGEDNGVRGPSAAVLVHRTGRSGLRVAAGMDHLVEGPDGTDVASECGADIARVTITAVLRPGERLRVLKLLGYGWSSVRSRQALWDQVTAAITAARHTGWDGLQAEQRGYLDTFWARAAVQLDGDPEIEHAARFGLFHVLQAGARAERRAIPAKGLTGTGYDGHAFWDTETFVLPPLTSSCPEAARDALLWRHSILPAARARAAALGHAGAAFPWRTIAGEECSAYWPAGTAAFHVNADIADAVVRYVDATDDTEFEAGFGLEILVETARLWCSLGHHDRHGRFRLPGVTGPDEYSALADDNVYTNLMAQQNLLAAATMAEKHLEAAGRLGVGEEERSRWQAAAEAMYVPYDSELGVHPQAEGFTTYQGWDFAGT
ncbi:MAG TPA: family 65 glycosyl hydrolase, partial [Acidimicrobiia bacterium]|nr:family 65 glycosyl hydrolase [Acidimicrobiia bacterium]